jgi:integrase/recombinase XerD
MPFKLTTIVSKIDTVPNPTNRDIIHEFYNYMSSRDLSANHQINNLKVAIMLANHFRSQSLLSVNSSQQIIDFLDSKKKPLDMDPERKWITTWNHYLHRTKLFFRWLHNRGKKNHSIEITDSGSDWVTPHFVQIKTKKTKRVSPYAETELWDRDEILLVAKYESYKRNKAILTLLWDLDARPHELTLLRIKNISIRERYGEGEIPHEAKTGSGPVLLTCSFPYVRDWLNEHPFRNEPDARLICNLTTGAPVRTLMRQLRARVIRLLDNGSILDVKEREKLWELINNKRWNPYCIRHSAITADSDFLPEYSLKKKVRWSMNSKQSARYIKRRMGNDLKQKILLHNGIVPPEELVRKPTILNCPRCTLVNAVENKYCSECSYPLTPSAFDEIKLAEEKKIASLEQKTKDDMDSLRSEVRDQLAAIMRLVRVNPSLAHIKPEILLSQL